MRRAEAVLQALIMIRSSIKPSLISFGRVDWRINTRRDSGQTGEVNWSWLEDTVPSSSRTDSPMVTLVSWFEYCKTMILVSSMPNL